MRKLFTVIAFLFFLLNLSIIVSKIYAQTDSVNVLEFQSKKNPENIEILKTGKRIRVKLKKDNNSYSFRGKLTAITDTNFVINNTYRIRFRSDLITDFRFNNHNHLFGKVILGIAGAGIFISFADLTAAATVVIPEWPVFAILFASIAFVGDIMLYKALTKNKHPVNNWNIDRKSVV